MCNAVVVRIKKDCGAAFKHIYPAEKWKFHFYGI